MRGPSSRRRCRRARPRSAPPAGASHRRRPRRAAPSRRWRCRSRSPRPRSQPPAASRPPSSRAVERPHLIVLCRIEPYTSRPWSSVAPILQPTRDAPQRRAHERAPRPLPRLPHAHGRRDRRRVPVPQLRPRVSPPASSACRGRGVTGGETMAAAAQLRAPVSRGRGDRGGDARRAGGRADAQPARAPARARRLLLRPRRRDPRARRPSAAASRSSGSTPTATSTRRRRPHRATRGGCRCGWRSTPVRCSPRTWPSSVPATSIRRSSSTWPTTGIDDDLDRALDGCDRVYVAFDCDVLRPGELSVLHARARRTDARRGGGASPRRRLRGCDLAGLGLTGLREDADRRRR